MKVLFFGDSITDGGRYRGHPGTYGYGTSYPIMVAEALYQEDYNNVVLNYGCGGDRITNLIERKETDLFDHKPDVVTILIGVNDVWHKLNYGTGTPLDKWEKIYRELLDEIRSRLPNTRIILMEPFFLSGDATNQFGEAFNEVYDYAKKAKELAKEYGLEFVELQEKFVELAKRIGNKKALYDGVHPDILGAVLIKDEWLKVFKSKWFKNMIKNTVCNETSGENKFTNFVHTYIQFVEDNQLLDIELWRRFVNQFKDKSDSFDLGWRGEYWGKMMRGASLTYSYTKNETLLKILKSTIFDILSTQDDSGRISTYSVDTEFQGWDMWCRKYVMLGMEYFLDVSDDKELNKLIIDSLKRQGDYILSKVGEDKKSIFDTTGKFWQGLNACSILEPFVKLFNLTNESKYLDFASYIVNNGFAEYQNLIDLALTEGVYPYQFISTKAYEMISCFEGLLEYYYVTQDSRYKAAVINFADKILETDFTVIGSAGCTHELFDHSSARQASINQGVGQETCVTVTLMKYLYRVHLLTGDPKYVDAFETSMYNAYFGAININKNVNKVLDGVDIKSVNVEPLPFDSYSPLRSGTRGRQIGGFKLMNDNHYYGCCACIGSAGVGLINKIAVLKKENAVVINLFIPGTYNLTTPLGNPLTITIDTSYPVDGKVSISLAYEGQEVFDVLVRDPKWNNGKDSRYALYKSNENITIDFNMVTRVIRPTYYGMQYLYTNLEWLTGHHHLAIDVQEPTALNSVCLIRGPIVLAKDSRVCNVDEVTDILIDKDIAIENSVNQSNKVNFNHIIDVEIKLKGEGATTLVDYASAGQTWSDESKMAAWFLVK